MATSVIIVNWNGCDLLLDCMTSLEAQTSPATEIIVVDNGSTDGSREFLQSFFPQVKVIPLSQNHGFARANNVGIQQTNSSRIALLNNDTVADSQWLQELNRALDKYPEVGFCASKILKYWEPEIIDSAGDVLGVAKAYKRGHGQADGPEYNEPMYVFGACAGAALYRREMLGTIGLFDEDFVTNIEDVDLSFRAQLAGFKCLYIPSAIVYHKVGETKRRTGWKGVEVNRRNSKLMWFKNVPLALMLKYLPWLLVNEWTDLRKCFWLSRKTGIGVNWSRLKAILRADFEFLRLLPATVRKRRHIQRNQRVSAKYIDSLIKRSPS